MVHLVSKKKEGTFEKVVEEIGTKVADMRVIIDRWTTRIEAHVSFFERFERFFLS
jgi:hypothetical protein